MGCEYETRRKEFNNLVRQKSITDDGIRLKGKQNNKRDKQIRSRAPNYLGNINNYRREALDYINQYRKKHQVNPLKLNPDLTNISQRYADQLAIKEDLDYSENQYKSETLGESLFQSFKKITAEKLVEKWYEEIYQYNFNDNDPEPSHFSQMVWKNTKEFGLGIALGESGNYYFVANYYPAGNISGKFRENVFPKKTVKNDNENTFSYNCNYNNNMNQNRNNNSNEYTIDWIDNNDFGKMSFIPNDFFNSFNLNFGFINNTNGINCRNNNNNNFNKTNSNGINYINCNNNANNKKNKKAQKIPLYIDQEVNRVDSQPENQSTATTGEFDQLCIEALEEHNKYRRLHHVPPLTLNKELCDIAKNYAEKLARADMLEHSDNTYKGDNLGENLYMCGGNKATGKEMTKSWYDEVKKHNFNGDYQGGTGHFTQLVWKNTKEVGFGWATNGRGSYYCVGNYYPAGNFMGMFQANVFPA